MIAIVTIDRGYQGQGGPLKKLVHFVYNVCEEKNSLSFCPYKIID